MNQKLILNFFDKFFVDTFYQFILEYKINKFNVNLVWISSNIDWFISKDQSIEMLLELIH